MINNLHQPSSHLSKEEYLSLEQEQDQRYEYFAGEVFAWFNDTYKRR